MSLYPRNVFRGMCSCIQRNVFLFSLYLYYRDKDKNMQSVEFTIIIIAIYNNINQQRQLKKMKKERRVIFKIKEQKKRKSKNAVGKRTDETSAKN